MQGGPPRPPRGGTHPDVIGEELTFDQIETHGDPSTWTYIGTKSVPATEQGLPKGTLKVYEVFIDKSGKGEDKVVGFDGVYLFLCWHGDGKRLLVTKHVPNQPDESVLLDPDTGKKEPVELPADARVLDWSRDGKRLIVYHKDKHLRLGLLEKGTKKPRSWQPRRRRFIGGTASRNLEWH
jgi:hypothetical protein